MDDPTRVKRALGHVLPEDAVTSDPYDDLARARTALRARSRRRFRIGLGALALAMIASVGVVGVFDRAAQPEDTTPSVTAGSIELLATTNDFVGKLVITFDHNPLSGQLVAGSGRQVWIHGDSGYTTLSMRTTAGEPAGVVRIQYPDNAGWDRSAMVRFLRSVHVGAGARASLG